MNTPVRKGSLFSGISGIFPFTAGEITSCPSICQGISEAICNFDTIFTRCKGYSMVGLDYDVGF